VSTERRPPLFVFGTLMDPEVLGIVCEAATGRAVTEPAVVENRARRWVVDDHYPVLVAAPGESVAGLLVHGLDERAHERVVFFEGEEFVLEPIVVRGGADGRGRLIEACFFAHTGCEAVSDMRWELADWQANVKSDTLLRIRRYMDCFGVMGVAEADAYW